MVVGGLVWLELGELRPVGLGALSLRTLVLYFALWLVLDPWRVLRAALLEPGAGGVLRLWWISLRIRIRVFRFLLGTAGPLRALLPLVGAGLLRRISQSKCVG